MTPLGHVSTSYLTANCLNEKLYLLPIIVGGLFPDIDFLFIIYPWFNSIHRTWTHNIPFVFIVALFSTLVFYKLDKYKVFLSTFIGGFLHLLTDSIMDSNPTNGIGVNILWPFVNYFFSPFNLMPLGESNAEWGNLSTILEKSIPGLMIETPFYILCSYYFLKQGHYRELKKYVWNLWNN